MPPSVRPAGRGRGFSLVELLIVIGIIVLLVGMLMPALSGARETAKRTSCLANLRSIGRGLLGYRYDNNGLIPEAQTFPVDPSLPTVMDSVNKYLDEQKLIWHCPADRELFRQFGTSYEYFVGFYLTMIEMDTLNATTKKNDLLAFFESRPSLAFIMIDADGWHPPGPGGSGQNALFLDGRADWFSIKQGP